MDQLNAEGRRETQPDLYVWELPVRIWHWVNALAIVILAVTGFLIGNPPPSVGGEAVSHFYFGDIRFIHFAAAYIFAVGFLVRFLWIFFGNSYSRELFYLPLWRPSWWKGLKEQIRWYSLLEKDPPVTTGHNPLAQAAMFLFLGVGSFFMILTGFALYSADQGAGSISARLFGWVVPLFGQLQDVRTWHHLGMWAIIFFVAFHIYMSVRDDIMGGESMIGTMVNGWRVYRGSRKRPEVS
jgi:Ni/Fe-hydrogenase 1 B-type cytochrome subunit